MVQVGRFILATTAATGNRIECRMDNFSVESRTAAGSATITIVVKYVEITLSDFAGMPAAATSPLSVRLRLSSYFVQHYNEA